MIPDIRGLPKCVVDEIKKANKGKLPDNPAIFARSLVAAQKICKAKDDAAKPPAPPPPPPGPPSIYETKEFLELSDCVKLKIKKQFGSKPPADKILLGKAVRDAIAQCKAEEKAKAEQEAKQKAEAEAKRKAEEARRKAEEEAKRRAEDAAKRTAEEERRRRERESPAPPPPRQDDAGVGASNPPVVADPEIAIPSFELPVEIKKPGFSLPEQAPPTPNIGEEFNFSENTKFSIANDLGFAGTPVAGSIQIVGPATIVVNNESVDADFDSFIRFQTQLKLMCFIGFREGEQKERFTNAPMWTEMTQKIFDQIVSSGVDLILCKIQKINKECKLVIEDSVFAVRVSDIDKKRLFKSSAKKQPLKELMTKDVLFRMIEDCKKYNPWEIRTDIEFPIGGLGEFSERTLELPTEQSMKVFESVVLVLNATQNKDVEILNRVKAWGDKQ